MGEVLLLNVIWSDRSVKLLVFSLAVGTVLNEDTGTMIWVLWMSKKKNDLLRPS